MTTLLTNKESLGISDKRSWKMFRGSSMRTAASASRISHKPSLLWVVLFHVLQCMMALVLGGTYAITTFATFYFRLPLRKR